MGLIPIGGTSLPNGTTLSTLSESGGVLLFNGTPIADGESAVVGVETHNLTTDDIDAKYFDLTGVALPGKDINLYVGGGELFRGVDWALIQGVGVYRRISWAGLAADGFLQAGDTLRIEYYHV